MTEPARRVAEISRDGLDAQARAGFLDARAWRRARELAGFTPDGARWRAFIANALALGGAMLLGTALVFFIAYNWEGMGRIARLVLVESAVLITAIGAILLGPRTLPGRAATLAAIIATGAMLAFIGQTYQTGADPWQLFAGWAVLCVPWALAAAWGPAWAALLVVANLGVALYVGEAWRPQALPDVGEKALPFALTIFNVAAAAAAERFGPRGDDGVHRLLPRLAALIALGAATIGMVVFVLDGRIGDVHLAIAYGVVVALGWLAYRVARRDLLLLSALALSVIVVVTTILVRLLQYAGDASGWLMLIAVAVIAMSAAAAHFIRKLAREEAT